MKITITGSTPDELIADMELAMNLLNPGRNDTLVATQEVPVVVQDAPTGAAPKKKRRTKAEIQWDKDHGVTLKMRKDMEVFKADNPGNDDEAALAYVMGGPQTPLPAQTPITHAAPAAPTMTLQADGTIGPAVDAPANPFAPAAVVVPPAPPQASQMFAAPPAAPAALMNGGTPPAEAAKVTHDTAQAANPAPGAPVTDAMLMAAFNNLATNVGQDAAMTVLTMTGQTQVGDIPMEMRDQVVAEIDKQIRAAG